MRARLGFGTGLLNDADVLLIDEVLSVGDKHFKQKATQALDAGLSGRRAIVIVSHDNAQMANLCTSTIELDEDRMPTKRTIVPQAED